MKLVLWTWLPLNPTIKHATGFANAQHCLLMLLLLLSTLLLYLHWLLLLLHRQRLLLKLHRLLQLHCLLLLQLPEPPVAAAAELVPPHLQLLPLLVNYKTLSLQ
jgi:hypothetical protein